MHNLVLSPIDPEALINRIADLTAEKVLKALRSQQIQDKNPDKLLTVEEAAEFLSLKVPTIYSKVSRGELPVMKGPKHLYFSSVELMKYLKEGRKKSNSDINDAAEAYLTNKKKL